MSSVVGLISFVVVESIGSSNQEMKPNLPNPACGLHTSCLGLIQLISGLILIEFLDWFELIHQSEMKSKNSTTGN